MKLPMSVFIDYFEELPVERAIEELSAAGFTHGELSIVHLAQLMEKPDPVATGTALKAAAEQNGYAIPQGHLSFRGGLVDDSALERLMPELDLFAAAGIGKAVLHTNGGDDLPDEVRYERWIHNLRKLSEYVEGTGVTLCIENLGSVPLCRSVHQIKGMIRDAGEKNLAICLDTGHLHLGNCQKWLQQSQREFILSAGDLLQALHITENNGIGDTHQMPFSARTGIDWKEVMCALRDVDYKGLFNLEILGECKAPMPIKQKKLEFIRTMCAHMLSDEFIN
ncbi:MAG: sugar phosphate isomerase/epimerase [Oscillospiraceae bacterium]|nr:sugar phosphate isomerase/epimerase [Oscillospiraceae bacterium]